MQDKNKFCWRKNIKNKKSQNGAYRINVFDQLIEAWMIPERLKYLLPVHYRIYNLPLHRVMNTKRGQYTESLTAIQQCYLTWITNIISDDTSGFRGRAYVKIAFNISRTSLKKSVYICISVDCNEKNSSLADKRTIIQ